MPDLSFDLALKVFGFVSGVGTLAVGWLLLRMRAEFASRGDHKALVERVEDVERGHAALAARMDEAPTHKDIADLMAKLADLSGDVRALDATLTTGMDGVREQLTMLVRHQLEKVPS